MRRFGTAVAALALLGGGLVAAALLSASSPQASTQALRLALATADSDGVRAAGDAPRGGLTRDYTSGVHATASVSATSPSATFGQPTIAGIGGWGFEADLRLDPSNANRIYMSAPDSANSDTSFIWRSLDGGRTFKWVPSATPLGGKPTTCHGGGDSELAVDSAGRLYFNDLTAANFSVARSDDQGRTFPCSNTGVPDAGVDRQWYALDGDPTTGGSLYLTNDEVGNGAVQCGNTQLNNSLVVYRSPVAGAGTTAGLAFGPANHVTLPGTCDEGIMGNDEVSPVATRTGLGGVTLATAVKHVYVIHDDGSLSKIRIARCFPVAFGAPLANVSDPSGLNCVDLPVADLGDPSLVRTGGNFPSLAIDKAGNLYAVWEQAPYDAVAKKAGDTALMYAYSTDEGNHWSQPIQVPTGLANNVFGWAAAGDDGRVDIAWYGASAHVDPNGGPNACPNGGPDAVDGSWSLYFTQTLNGHSSAVTFSTPVVAGEHPIRRGSIQTIIGNQCGGQSNTGATNRTLGDFFQLRIGSKGEAQISYADSTSLLNSLLGSHAMYVRQNGGTGVYAGISPKGDPILLDSATDPAKDATYDALGVTSANMPNLDVLASSVSWPRTTACHPAGTACLRVTMKLSNLSTAAPASPDTDSDLVWLTQWSTPAVGTCTSTAPTCANGGANLFVYAESSSGGAIQCFTGQSSLTPVNGALGLSIAYPGSTQLTAPGACVVVPGANGTITIDVPLTQVSLDSGVAPFSPRLYSVTASTMTLPQPANTVPASGGLGGVPFDLIDVVRAYDAKP